MKYTQRIIWTIVLTPVVVAILSMPFLIIGTGITLIFDLQWPVIELPEKVLSGLGMLWLGLLVLAFGLSLAADITREG